MFCSTARVQSCYISCCCQARFLGGLICFSGGNGMTKCSEIVLMVAKEALHSHVFHFSLLTLNLQLLCHVVNTFCADIIYGRRASHAFSVYSQVAHERSVQGNELLYTYKYMHTKYAIYTHTNKLYIPTTYPLHYNHTYL